jgi:hypothetical protein
LARTAPISLAVEHVLPVLGPLEPLFPGRGLPRGSVVEVGGGTGATSVMLALAAGGTRAGSWMACVGLPQLGWEAAEEHGVDLARVVAVPHPADRWPMVVGALIDGVDMVVCGPGIVPTAAQLRALRARARERGTVLLGLDGRGASSPEGSARSRRGGRHVGRRGWESADLVLEVHATRWGDPGIRWGVLGAREVEVVLSGRGSFARSRTLRLALRTSGALHELRGIASPGGDPDHQVATARRSTPSPAPVKGRPRRWPAELEQVG